MQHKLRVVGFVEVLTCEISSGCSLGTWVLWCSQKAAVFRVQSWHFKGQVQCAGLLCILAVAKRIGDCIPKCLQL